VARNQSVPPASFAQIGVVGKREFTDESIPAGAAAMQYQIFGFRSQTAGPASPVFTLQFGHPSGGFSVTTEKVPLRVAA